MSGEQQTGRRILVFCASSASCDAHYHDAAADLGRALADAGDTLVYGGCAVGSLGALATGAPPQGGPRGVPGLLVVKRLTMRGFIVSDFFEGSSVGNRTDAINQLKEWVDAGKLHVLEDIIDGFDNVPDALIGLLAGHDNGKPLVRLDD